MTYDLSTAINIAQDAHKGQYRKYNQRDYYCEHPFKVMRLVRNSEPNSIAYEMAGVLHDVIEDSDYTIGDLRKEGIPEDVLAAVDLLTHREEDTYADYIIKLKPNEIARRVKIADMLNNMTDFFIYNQEKKMQKYLKHIEYLINDD